MKIRIHREKYLNHQCPVVPKQVWDVFYSHLMMRTRDRIPSHIKVINTIDIRVNQAYAGIHNFHFYVSFNGTEEIHQEIHIGDRAYWGDYDTGEVDRGAHPRGEWLADFESHLDLDVGPNRMADKIEAHWAGVKEAEEKEKERKQMTDTWFHYLELKEFFEQ
jgi:hypothetical protein